MGGLLHAPVPRDASCVFCCSISSLDGPLHVHVTFINNQPTHQVDVMHKHMHDFSIKPQMPFSSA